MTVFHALYKDADGVESTFINTLFTNHKTAFIKEFAL